MKFSIKRIVLILFLIFFVTGCGWDDVKKEYEDVLKKEPSCIYYSEMMGYDTFGIKTLRLSANTKGFYLNINNEKDQLLFGADGGNLNPIIGGALINFSEDFLKSFANKYLEDNSCPNSMYILQDNMSTSARISDCKDLGSCYQYSLKQPTITTPEGEKKDCHYTGAINCEKIIKNDDQYGNKVYLEFGYYKDGNGEKKKYFGVANNENYINISLSTKENELFLVSLDTAFYQIASTEAIKEIWLPDDNFIESKDLIIKSSVYGIGDSTYYISGPNTFNYGTYDNTGETETAPNIDPDTEIKPPNYGNTHLDYSSICSNNTEGNRGIRQAFKTVGYLIQMIKWIVPLIIIILGMIDFGKAAISSDEKAINKAMLALVRRVLAGIIIFFIPTIVMAILNAIEVSKGIEKEDNTQFGACTKCLFDPYNSCD